MKKYLALIISLLPYVLQAQMQTLSPVGEYYITGEREIAAGFQINADSSFHFFLSYGAMDRQGTGKWEVVNNQLVLLSSDTSKQHFLLQEQTQMPGNDVNIKFVQTNPNMFHFIFAVLIVNGKRFMQKANEEGEITFLNTKADMLEVYFKWCPDKVSIYDVKGTTNNYFTFSPKSNLMDVNFKETKLQFTGKEMSGRLTFFDERIMRFTKVEK